MFRNTLLASVLLLLLGNNLPAQPLRLVVTADSIGIWDGPEHVVSFPNQPAFLEQYDDEGKPKSKFGNYGYRTKTKMQWRFSHFEKTSYAATDELNAKETLTGKNKGRTIESNFGLRVTKPAPETYDISIVYRGNANRMRLTYLVDPGAALFGFGEQFSHVDLRGHIVPMIPEENGIGRGDRGVTGKTRLVGAAGHPTATYLPAPFHFASTGGSYEFSHQAPLEYDLQQAGKVTVTATSGMATLRVRRHADPLQSLSDLHKTGPQQPRLPDWTWGTWIGLQGGPDKARRIVAEAKAAGNPVTAIWIQDWVGKRKVALGSRLNWHWTANEEAYPEIRAFIAEMRAQGVHVLGYINPFLVADSPWADSLRPYLLQDPATREAHVIAAGGFDAYHFALHDFKAQKALKEMIQTEMIELGFSGWMADFAEWYPAELYGTQHDSQDARPWFHHRQQYPLQWQEVNRRAITDTPEADRLTFFSRSGFGTRQWAPIHWAGDQNTSWGEDDGLPSAIKALITSGMSGVCVNHSDIGGYTNLSLPGYKMHRDRELLYRWAEFAAFTPIFRTHEGLNPEENLQVYSDPEAVAFFARMGQLHHALRDYFTYLNEEASEKGWPMIRHPWLHFPDDPATSTLAYEYLLGEDLLILPVYKPGADSVSGYFPAGTWQHLWTGDIYPGKENHTVNAPQGQPAAFVKVGGKWSERIMKAVEGLK